MKNIDWKFVLVETFDWLRIFLAVYGLSLVQSQNQIIAWGILIFYIGMYRSKK